MVTTQKRGREIKTKIDPLGKPRGNNLSIPTVKQEAWKADVISDKFM